MAATAQETEQITQTLDRYVESVRYAATRRSCGTSSTPRPACGLAATRRPSPRWSSTATSRRRSSPKRASGGSVSVVDFFALARIDGAWKIVNKSFIHTGGELPAE